MNHKNAGAARRGRHQQQPVISSEARAASTTMAAEPCNAAHSGVQRAAPDSTGGVLWRDAEAATPVGPRTNLAPSGAIGQTKGEVGRIVHAGARSGGREWSGDGPVGLGRAGINATERGTVLE